MLLAGASSKRAITMLISVSSISPLVLLLQFALLLEPDILSAHHQHLFDQTP